MTTTLPEFLGARLDEEQRVAEAATPGPWQWGTPPPVFMKGGGSALYGPSHPVSRERQLILITTKRDIGYPDGDFIAYHNPARVLAEIAAKRAILELHAPWEDSDCCSSCGDVPQVDYPCETLKVMAGAYADHPDFQAEWRAEA